MLLKSYRCYTKNYIICMTKKDTILDLKEKV